MSRWAGEERVSPVFDREDELYAWAEAQGWERLDVSTFRTTDGRVATNRMAARDRGAGGSRGKGQAWYAPQEKTYWRCLAPGQDPDASGLCVSCHRTEGAAQKHCLRLTRAHGVEFQPRSVRRKS